MPISTKKGDKGFTKHHLKPETYGTLDELNSFLGMARAVSRDRKVKKILFAIQNHFFIIGSELALSGKDRSLLKGEITQKEVDWLSHQAGFTGEGGARVRF
ncbi:MAG: ATP:cob(I)alamin adenosyltransferase [Thermodesulfobacteriota bacterium]